MNAPPNLAHKGAGLRRLSGLIRARCRLTGLALCLLLLAGLLAPAPIQASDPRLVWRTLRTPHFSIHFPSGAFERAQDSAGRLERAHSLLVPLLGHRPWRRTEVILRDREDDANGSATAYPFPTIEARLVPPASDSVLGHYDDYLWLLLAHEYVHILHLDTTQGLPKLGNQIFGHLFAPNGFQPNWVVEGLATRYESLLSGQGRNNSSRVDMMLRAQLLAPKGLTGIGTLNAAPTAWPGGSLWYLEGGRVWEEIVRQAGEAAPARMSNDYGAQLLPFGYNLSALRSAGLGLEEAFSRWQKAEEARSLALLSARRQAGLIEGQQLTTRGRLLHDPRFTAEGRIEFRSSDGASFPGVFEISWQGPGTQPSAAHRLARVAGLKSYAPIAGGQGLLTARVEAFDRFAFATDLFAQSLPRGSQRSLPSGAVSPPSPLDASQELALSLGLRARQIAVSADGRSLAILSTRRGEEALYLARLHSAPAATLGAPPVVSLGPLRLLYHQRGVQLDRPVFDPKGERVAVAFHPQGGSWDLGLLQLRGGGGSQPAKVPAPAPDLAPDTSERMQVLAQSPADELHPCFAQGGRSLIFSADHEGVFDLFLLRLPVQQLLGEDDTPHAPISQPLRRLTRVRTGAFEAQLSPAGQFIVYVGYTPKGYELFGLPFDPEHAQPALFTATQRASPSRFKPTANSYPVEPYRALPMLRPFYWLPTLGADAFGSTLGAQTSGGDLVGQQFYAASAWWGLSSGSPGFSAAYAYQGLQPTLVASASSVLGVASLRRDGQRRYFAQREHRVSLEARFDDSHYDRYQALSLTLGLSRLLPRLQLNGLWAGERPTRLPKARWDNGLGVSWRASTVHRFSELPSASEGVTLLLRGFLATRVLGSDSDRLTVSATLTAFTKVPWSSRQVLGLRLRAAAALGSSNRARYSLGGGAFSDPVRAAIDGNYLAPTLLRGFPQAVVSGDGLLAANLEFRQSLWEADAGLGTIPMFLRRVSGVLFLDGGSAEALLTLLHAPHPLFGLGAELRADLVAGYSMALQARLGLARGLGRLGAWTPYAGLGGSY